MRPRILKRQVLDLLWLHARGPTHRLRAELELADLIRDDDIFNAAVVSFGTFGIIRDKNGYAPGINILRVVGLFRFLPRRIITGIQFKQYRKLALLNGVRGTPGQLYTSSIYDLEGYTETAFGFL